MHELRYALRALARTPAFTLAAVVSLAIGIGANTAIFSVASALLIRPLPYADADRLVILWNRSPGLGITEDWFSTAQYFDVRNGHQGFDDVAIALGANANLTGDDGEPERIGAIRMSSNLLPMLGARAEIGRLLTVAEDAEGGPASVVLGYGTWVRRYGSDPSVLGRKILVNGESYEIVGVLPASFTLPREVLPTLGGAPDAEIVLPLPLGPKAVTFRGREDYNIIGRLKRGVTADAAQAEMDALTARLRRDHPDVYPPNGGLTFSIVPLQQQVVGGVRASILVLSGAVALVLLIACANAANLLLARAVARRRELAIRAALGASVRRLARQLLVESVTLSVLGGAAGLAVAAAGVAALRGLGRASVPRVAAVHLDAGVLAFTAVVSVLAGLLFGLAPLFRLRDDASAAPLADSTRGSSGAGSLWGRGHRTRRVLVIAELALAVVLAAGAGLLVRSFAELLRVPAGFESAQRLTFELTATGRKYPNGARVGDAYRDLRDRLRALPGVADAGLVSALPLSQMFSWGPVTIEGRQPPPGEKFVNVDERMITPGYLRTMAIPIVEGRDFDDHDGRDGARVAIVDERMAREMWPGQSPVGRRLRLGGADSTSPWITVVGVAGAVKQDALDSESRIAVYLPHAQFPARAMTVVLRASGAAESVAGAAREALRAFDPDLPVYNLRSMESRVAESLARRRLAMLLLACFAAIAVTLAAVGVYGVISYIVSQGRRELGIRLALGASPRALVRMILAQGAAVAGLGIGIGLVAALALARLVRSLVFGIGITDPATYGGVALVLGVVAFVACLVPAARAARVDPALSLRAE
jgi:predicted permease